MASKQQSISRKGLYRKTYDRKKFAIIIGNKPFRPIYINSAKRLNLGDVVAYVSNVPGEARIGIIKSFNNADDTIDIRVIPQSHIALSTVTGLNIHSSDVYCRFALMPKPETDLYRLWFEYPDKETSRQATIKVDVNFRALQRMQRVLQDKADKIGAYEYKYHVEKV